ncbi:MAG: M64 family metallopeptidase [Nanoarchaeota archaeon]|nr:M64 family metallopeptidase [Nanoarchaeota archaeon]
MQKRGQSQLLYYFIALLLLGAIALSYKSVHEVGQRQADADVQIFVSSLQAKVLQQGAQGKGSASNASFSVPGTVSEVCFFDSQTPSDPVSNVELTQLFADDTQHTLFLKEKTDYAPFALDKVSFSQNPLCFPVKQNAVSLDLESTGKGTLIRGAGMAKCTTVLQSGSPEEKIDLVFLGSGYGEEAFSKEVSRYANNILLSFAPFSENRMKFNVYRVSTPVSCQMGDYISCDPFKVQIAASACPLDYAIVLVDRSLVADFIRPVRSSTANGIVKLNTADRSFVIAHEFGHIFGLADEYVDAAYFAGRFNPGDYPNCASAPCSSWSGVSGAGCFQGCSLDSYFRATPTSIMRDLASSEFGPVGTQEIQQRLDRYE